MFAEEEIDRVIEESREFHFGTVFARIFYPISPIQLCTLLTGCVFAQGSQGPTFLNWVSESSKRLALSCICCTFYGS